MLGSSIVDILAVLLVLATSLLISVPLTGSLVRLRANYNPKGLQLDEDGVVQPYTGPQITSFFGMLARVKRIEGWGGLYKGLMPTLLSTVVLVVFATLFYDGFEGQPRNHGLPNPPRAGAFGTLMYSIFWIMVSLPGVVIAYRAITTPYKLPYFQPMYCLRILLTPTEMRRPWLLYFTPGLLACELLATAYGILGLRTIRHFILPEYQAGEPLPEGYTPLRFGLYFLVVILSTAVLCPLEVMTTKLAIQRNHASSEYNSVSQETEGDAEGTIDYSSTEEDVIGLRHERDPYTSLVDCAKRIVDEEGLSALYRAWWVTMLVCMGTAFSS
jgi:hypothetical protein